ncbi:MAG: UDP-N-acetylglucosamine 2-epimerase, partial [Desulfobacterales bacterium]|nr:UDP-N-acetylglucosamine 2-epimerase [Desulfobacterales bacterium]
MKIHLIAAARPNFMKIAPLYHELNKREGFEPIIVHTGQHYDLNMSDVFFKNFNLPEPHIHLGVGSGTHAFQTANVMIAYEKVLLKDKPDLTIVVGDVNSTVAATMVAVKAGISKKIPLIFPVHPRTLAKLKEYNLNKILANKTSIHLSTPLGYIDFMNLVFNSKFA